MSAMAPVWGARVQGALGEGSSSEGVASASSQPKKRFKPESAGQVVPLRSRCDVPFHIVIELDLSSLGSFAFFAAYHLAKRRSALKRDDRVTWRVSTSTVDNIVAPRVYWAPWEESKCSDACANHELVTKTTLTSLAWACNHTSFYGKRRGRIFCEHMEASLLKEILEVRGNVESNVYTCDHMPIPPTVYELQKALCQREYIASRYANTNGKVRTGFCQADVLTFCYFSYVVIAAARPENGSLRARLIAEVPRVLDWWRRIQLLLVENLAWDKIKAHSGGIRSSAFCCCYHGVNPLNVDATSSWLYSEEIQVEFQRQVEATGEFVGIQSRPAIAGKKKKKKTTTKEKAGVNDVALNQDAEKSATDVIVAVVGKLVKSGAHVKFENVDDSGPTTTEQRAVIVPWDALPPRLNPEHYETGQLKTVKKREKKRQQIANMIEHVSRLLPARVSKGKAVAVDFCCGSGHVGLVLAAMRPDIDVYFLDCNAVALAHAKNRAAQLQIHNVKFLRMDIKEYPVLDLPFHVGFALHGCGPATDFVLDKCLAARASYVMCPCCVGFIQNEKEKERLLPSSEMYRRTCGVTRDEFIRLSQRADHTGLQGSVGEQGQYAMRLVNEDRNCRAREFNPNDDGGGMYTTFHFDMYPKTCSPKHQMIVGRNNNLLISA